MTGQLEAFYNFFLQYMYLELKNITGLDIVTWSTACLKGGPNSRNTMRIAG